MTKLSLGRWQVAVVLLAITAAACVQDPVQPKPAKDGQSIDARAGREKLWGKPAADAPVELMQFGQLTGRWECQVEEHAPDRGWRRRPGSALWTWFYTLNGRAVQDIWAPRADGSKVAAAGTNLRVYDAGQDIWRSVWTSSDRPQFEQWQGSAAGDEIVMQTGRGEHRAQITFHDIGERSFDWRYERFGDGAWQASLRTHCKRIG